MLQENFQPQEDQNDAAGQLRLLPVPGSKPVAQLHAKGGKQEGGETNEGDCHPNAGEVEMAIHKQGQTHPGHQGDAGCQGVNAGGNGQQEHGPGGQIPGDLFLLCAGETGCGSKCS